MGDEMKTRLATPEEAEEANRRYNPFYGWTQKQYEDSLAAYDAEQEAKARELYGDQPIFPVPDVPYD